MKALCLGILFMAMLVCSLLYVLAVDAWVRYLYKSRRDKWFSLGQPGGYFFMPPGTLHWGGLVGQKFLQLKWIVDPPDWTYETKETWRAMIMMRLASVGGFMFFIMFAIIAAYWR